MSVIEVDLGNVSDPEDLMKVFEQIEAGDTPTIDKPEIKTSESPETKESNNEPVTTQPQKTEQGQEPDPDGVATKDGKHVIPYTVLKGERDRANRAEQLATEMRERVAALEAMVQGSQGAKQGESARTEQSQTASDISPEDLEALKDDFPTVYKAVMASMAAAERLQSQLEPVKASVQSVEAERAQNATDEVQDAIDSIPKLAHIQATNADAFDLAKQLDKTLREQPAWQDKSLAQRFAKVTEMVEATLGAIEIPGSSQSTPQLSADDLKRAAQAKAQATAKASSSVPTSLSDFPAGQAAAQDEREAAEQLNVLQLAEKFSGMTPEQMDAYFLNL